jgi:hypothetical protein
MSEPSVYELLGNQIENGFERIDRRMAEVVEQQRITNGRVTEAHIQLAVHKARLDADEERIAVVSTRSHETFNKLQTFMAGGAASSIQKMIARDVGLVISTVTLMFAIAKIFKVIQ